jgi:methyl-accepting chemotaxis protein
MSVAEDTTQVPVPIPEVVAVVNDLISTISNTLETPLSSVSETPKLVEIATKTLLKESQSVIDETTKLMDNITSIMANKNDPTKLIVDAKAIMSEGEAIVDETTKLVESAVKTAEETISRLSIEMEQDVKKATGLFTKIHKFIKLIMSCMHRADKSVSVPVVVKTDHVNVV